MLYRITGIISFRKNYICTYICFIFVYISGGNINNNSESNLIDCSSTSSERFSEELYNPSIEFY